MVYYDRKPTKSDFIFMVVGPSLFIFDCLMRFLFIFFSIATIEAFLITPLRTIKKIVKRTLGWTEPKRSEIFKYRDTPGLLKYHGYGCEQHVVVTPDKYVLVLFRIVPRPKPVNTVKSSNRSVKSFATTSSVSISSSRGMPILLLHGAILSSDAWVCREETNMNMAIALTEAGFDVWMANRRGNKYSQKHLEYSSDEQRYWDYSIDHTIVYDVQANIDHILHVTGYKTISVLGFSQGTAEFFGALSLNPGLEKKINAFVAVSAASRIKRSPAVIMELSCRFPFLLRLIGGSRSLFPSMSLLQSLLSPETFAFISKTCFKHMILMDYINISPKEDANIHRFHFSAASVRQVQHWLQIASSGRFQMYSKHAASLDYVIPDYPIENVSVPTAVFVGVKDAFVDHENLLKMYPNAQITRIADYEHCDPMWAVDCDVKVFPYIIDYLRRHTTIDNYYSLLNDMKDVKAIL